MMWMSLYCVLPFLLFWGNTGLAGDASLNTKNRIDQRELVYLQILNTNGFFAPLHLYPTDENTEEDWPEGMGLLTKLGKLQQFELGKLLRRRYNHFITSNPNEMDAFSAADDRSTISLLSFLASLYEPTKEWQFVPGFRWQPTVISYMESDDIFFSFYDGCLAQYEERDDILESKYVQDIIDKDKFYYEYWSENSGRNITDLVDVAFLHDIIQKEDKMGLKVPRWARTHMKHMKRISDIAFTSTYNSTTSLALKIGPLIELLTLRMRVKVIPEDPSPEIKVSVYVTHDWNLAALLLAMGHSNGQCPPPAASIVFEMYQDPGDKYSVRALFYNSTSPEAGYQDPHVLVLDGCTEYCPLPTFTKFFEAVIPEEWEKLCERRVVFGPQDEDEEQQEAATLYPMYQELKLITLPTESPAV